MKKYYKALLPGMILMIFVVYLPMFFKQTPHRSLETSTKDPVVAFVSLSEGENLPMDDYNNLNEWCKTDLGVLKLKISRKLGREVTNREIWEVVHDQGLLVGNPLRKKEVK